MNTALGPHTRRGGAGMMPAAISMEILQVGDRLVDEKAEWEVIGRPYTTAGGKTAHVRVQKVANADATEIRTWGAPSPSR